MSLSLDAAQLTICAQPFWPLQQAVSPWEGRAKLIVGTAPKDAIEPHPEAPMTRVQLREN